MLSRILRQSTLSIVLSHGGLGKSWKCHFWEFIPALSIVQSHVGLGKSWKWNFWEFITALSIVQSHGGLGKSWKCHFWEFIPALSIVLSRGGLGSRRSNYLKCLETPEHTFAEQCSRTYRSRTYCSRTYEHYEHMFENHLRYCSSSWNIASTS